MINDPFHQIVSVEIDLGKKFSPGEINRILKESGATLHYNVYSFEKPEKGPIWQSESYIYVALFCDDKEVDAQESINRIQFQYPMATIGTEYITKFVDTVALIALYFNVPLVFNGEPINKSGLVSYLESVAAEIMSEWGEEPGSKYLRILIEQNL